MNNKCNLWEMNLWMHQTWKQDKKGKSQWKTSKCSKIGCVKKPNKAFNHSLRNTINNNPTIGNECSSWWQSWTYSIIWWSCLHMTTMAICNPRLQFTHNWCIYTNCNNCWFSKPPTKHQNQFGTLWWWNDFTYSIGWSNFITSTKNHLIKLISIPHIQILNPEQHP